MQHTAAELATFSSPGVANLKTSDGFSCQVLRPRRIVGVSNGLGAVFPEGTATRPEGVAAKQFAGELWCGIDSLAVAGVAAYLETSGGLTVKGASRARAERRFLP
jgi:hypothetical protein